MLQAEALSDRRRGPSTSNRAAWLRLRSLGSRRHATGAAQLLVIGLPGRIDQAFSASLLDRADDHPRHQAVVLVLDRSPDIQEEQTQEPPPQGCLVVEVLRHVLAVQIELVAEVHALQM